MDMLIISKLTCISPSGKANYRKRNTIRGRDNIQTMKIFVLKRKK